MVAKGVIGEATTAPMLNGTGARRLVRQLMGRCFRVGLAVPRQALSATSPGSGVIQPIPGLIVCPTRHGEARGGRHTMAGTSDDMLVRG